MFAYQCAAEEQELPLEGEGDFGNVSSEFARFAIAIDNLKHP